jgi:hypothetical protein
MGRIRRSLPILPIAAMSFAASAQSADEAQFTGRFSLGARGVDLGGSESKYREDINLDDGPRVFDIGFVFVPSGTDRPVDRVDVDISSLGGEPYESMHLEVRKYGAYKLKVDRRRSEYFYEDVILPAALASVSGSTAGDFHHADFERVRDIAELDITVSPNTRLNVDLERSTRRGETTTTLDVQRDEFELERPIDESLGTFTVGIQHDWDKLTLIAEQRLGDYENVTELFLPGFSRGENTADTAELNLFNAEQPYDYESRSQSLRLLARPNSRLDLQGGWRHENLDLDMQSMDSAAGVGFDGLPFTTSLDGAASVDRDMDFIDFKVGYAFSQRLRFVVAGSETRLEQAGDLSYGSQSGDSDWSIETTGFDARLEIAAAPRVLVGVGWSTEQRDLDYRHSLDAQSRLDASRTRRDGFLLSLSFDPSGPLSLNASVEDNSIDDPFSLSAPTQGRRYRVHGKYRWDNGIALTASYRHNDLENDLSLWRGDTQQSDLRLSYNKPALQLSAGYGRVDYSRNVERLVVGGPRQDIFAIDYGAESTFVDAAARWQASPAVAVGGHARSYDNRGSFALERDDWRGFVEVAFGRGYLLQIAERRIDYVEDGFDDFDVGLTEIAIAYRW